MAKAIKLTLEKDKETPGKIRYRDDDGHSLYFSKSEVADAGFGDEVEVTVKNPGKE